MTATLRCSGVTATWCPLCGDCTCERHEGGEVEFDGLGNCPLHVFDSPHATGIMERATSRPLGRAMSIVACAERPAEPEHNIAGA